MIHEDLSDDEDEFHSGDSDSVISRCNSRQYHQSSTRSFSDAKFTSSSSSSNSTIDDSKRQVPGGPIKRSPTRRRPYNLALPPVAEHVDDDNDEHETGDVFVWLLFLVHPYLKRKARWSFSSRSENDPWTTAVGKDSRIQRRQRAARCFRRRRRQSNVSITESTGNRIREKFIQITIVSRERKILETIKQRFFSFSNSIFTRIYNPISLPWQKKVRQTQTSSRNITIEK